MNNVEIFDKLLDTLESHVEYVTIMCDTCVTFILPNSKSQVKELTFSVSEWALGKKDYSLDILKPIAHTNESCVVTSEEVDKETFAMFRYRLLQLKKVFTRFHLDELNEFIND
jgi:hypothetical protein